jgi:hypothetical protein
MLAPLVGMAPEVFGELHRNSGLIIILSQSKVNTFNFVKNAVMSVEQIVQSLVRCNGTHRQSLIRKVL